ncbi:FAD-binding protein [Pseudocitrobacter cyperus]|uniref:FAD-binding protein n=1 Tax=Pseudocitrobacter cyperus TaxID=3112843 RepID=A0ABV0HKR3_9ENTR
MATLLPSVFVYADNTQRMAELVALGRQWGQRVHLLFIGSDAQAQECLSLGADVIHHFSAQEGVIVEDYALSFSQVIRDANSQGLVVFSASKRGKAIAARVAARLECAAINDASSVEIAEGAMMVSHPLYGGLAHGRVQLRSAWNVITLGAGQTADGAAASVTATVEPAAFIAPPHAIKFLSRKLKPASQVDLGKAKCVVGVGRGFAKEEDLALAQQLAAVLHAEVGCSRPIAEGEGWMEQERYVGVSGVALGADVYIAAGISGQIQHMVGVNRVKTIVAVNKDKNAPIFSVADYGIVGDLYKILPELSKKMAE